MWLTLVLRYANIHTNGMYNKGGKYEKSKFCNGSSGADHILVW